MLNRRLLKSALTARSGLVLTIVLGFAGGVLAALQARLLSQVVSRVFLDGADLAGVSRLLLILPVIVLARAILAWGGELSGDGVAARVKTSLRRELIDRIRDLGPVYTRGERSGELVNTALEGVEALDAYFREYLPQAALAALVPAALMALVFPIDWVSGVILLLTAPLIPLFMLLIGGAAEALTRRQWQALSRMSAHLLDVLQGLPALKLLGRSHDQARVIAQVSERHRSATMGVLRVAFLSALALELLSTLSTALIAVGIGLRLLEGSLSFVDAFFVLLLAPDVYLPLRLLGTRFHAGVAGETAAARIFAILDSQPNGAATGEVLPGSPSSAPEVTFEHVSYTYPGASQPALRDICVRLAAGERAALVGPSGAGKSTFAALLLGFIAPSAGRVLVDGIPLEAVPPAVWRRRVAWVPQSPHLFGGSVAENLRLARPEADDAALAAAIQAAGAADFIAALPQGLDTPIGERAARLSGGQAQRLALARAFLKDAPLLVLDEASANLDPLLAARIQDAALRLSRGRTALMIAHRLETARSADRVLVLEGGRLVQSGSHAALLDQPGLYRDLVAAHPALTDAAARSTDLSEGVEDDPALIQAPPRDEHGRADGTLRLLLSFLAPHWQRAALSVLLGFATIVSGVGLMTTAGYLIAAAALQPSIAALQVAIVGVRFFGITRGVFRYLERLASHQVTLRVLARMRVWFYQALEPLAPARLEDFHSGDLLNRVIANISVLENFYIRAVAPPVVAALVIAAAGLFMAAYHPLLAAALVGFLALAGVGVPLIIGALSRKPGRQAVRTRSALSAALVDAVQGLADLLIFDAAGSQRERVERLSQKHQQALSGLARANALQSGLMLLLNHLAALVALWLAVPLVRAGAFDGIGLAVILLLALASFEAVQALPQAASQWERSQQAARDLQRVVNTEPEVTPPEHPSQLTVQPDLTLRGLTYTYPGARRPALHDLTLDLARGRRVAVVGPSGAGKSTLVGLLARFRQAPPGTILLGGRDVRDFQPEEVRAAMAVVSQRAHLFNATIRENLLLARPDASQAALEDACRRAQLHDFILSLPAGYDTWIGEHGLRLSGGERQRLAIARAVLQDAPILVLDEVTANLDTLTGGALWSALQELMRERAALVITHRLTGLEEMDEIVVLRAGRVVERGRHADLLASGGLYARMLGRQAGAWD